MMDIELKLSPEMIEAGIDAITNEIEIAYFGNEYFFDPEIMFYYTNRARLYRALRNAQDIHATKGDA